MTTTTTHPCPSLEEIAALLDGKLEGEERARVIQHLDECPDCYETFAGTARFLREEAEEEEAEEEKGLDEQTKGGDVVPFPLGGGDRQSWRRWLPLAAGVILVAGLAGTGYVSLFAPPRMKAEELVGQLEGKGTIYPWEVNRGDGGGAHSLQLSAPSFLIGAWLVDQQVAIRSRNADSAQDLSRRIGLALANLGMEEEAEPFKQEWQKKLTTSSQTASKRESSLEKDNAALDTDYLALGKWAEAARIAAATRNVRFFESRDYRRVPSYFLRKHGEDFEAGSQLEEARKPLEAVAQTLGNNDLDAAGFKELERSLDGLIHQFETLADEDAGETGMPEEEQ